MLMQRLVLTLALVPACSEHAPSFYGITDWEVTEPTTDSSTSGGPEPGSEDTGAATTGEAPTSAADFTTGDDDKSSSSGSSPIDPPPHVLAFTVDTNNDTPGEIFEAGAVQLDVQASDDVVDVDVLYGDTIVATLPIAAFPYAFDITSQTMCDGPRSFTAIVRDEAGQTDMRSADLYCQLPAPGSEEHTTSYPAASGSSGAAIASSPDGSVVVAGVLDGRMALWRLDPGGNVAAGWPKTLADWTMHDDLKDTESNATAVSVDTTGAIFVGGTTKSGGTTQAYLAKLSDQGQRLWEDPGLEDGEEITALATSAAGDTVAAGSLRTSEQPPAYDWRVWGYTKQGARWEDKLMQPDTDPKPDLQNKRSERARAVVALPNGEFVVAGERDYVDIKFDLFTRATVQRYTSDGAHKGDLWTSSGLTFDHDAALAATVTDAGFSVAGWCQFWKAGSVRQVCVQSFDADGAPVGSYPVPSPTQAEARGAAQDREGKLVLAGFLTKPGQTDAWAFASVAADQPLTWEQKYDGGGIDFASAVTCDSWGHCTWVGTTIENGLLTLVVSRRNP